MAHISDHGGKKLLARVRRIRGQIEGIERAIQETDPRIADVLVHIEPAARK